VLPYTTFHTTWKISHSCEKWAKAKPSFEHFIKEIKQYGNSLDTIKNKKARKTYMKAFCNFNL